MGNYTIYRLKFNTQLHTGRDTGSAQVGSLGLEKTETYLPADTLFSAICQTWSTFYGEQDLKTFLKGYTEDREQLPFMLTSAFPYASDIYLYPRPLTWHEKTKESKGVRFVSQSIFQDIIAGSPPQFCKDDLINGGAVWVSAAEKEHLKELYCEEDEEEEEEEDEDAKDDEIDIWETNTRPRVTIGSRNSGSEIWHVDTVEFNDDCGLWFAAKYDLNKTKQKIETLLRVLGDTGIGGERNAGYGTFKLKKPKKTVEMPTVPTVDHFITLSRISPKSSVQLGQLLTGDVAYNLTSLSGRMTNADSDTRRKEIHLFTEGSVLHADEEPVGRLVDYKPDDCLHPVYRYGYAWQIGITGVENETEIST